MSLFYTYVEGWDDQFVSWEELAEREFEYDDESEVSGENCFS